MSEDILGKTCTACGTARKVKALLYDPNTLKAYCNNPYVCKSDNHPNTPANIIRNEKETILLPFAEVDKLYKERLLQKHGNPDTVEKIRKLLERPTTLRINDALMAQYLVDIEQEYNLDSLSEAIRLCVQDAMDRGQLFEVRQRKTIKDFHDDKQIAQVTKEIEQPKPEPIKQPEQPTTAPIAVPDEDLVF